MNKRLIALMLPLFLSTYAYANVDGTSLTNNEEKKETRQRIHLGPFEGPAVFAGIGYGLNETRYAMNYDIYGSEKVTDNSGNIFVGAEYGIPVGNNFIVGLGADLSLSKIDFGKTDFKKKGNDIISLEMKNRASFYALAGYKILPDLMAYGKLSFQYAKGTYKDNYSSTKLSAVYGEGSKNFTGMGIGFGVSYAVTSNFESSFEAKYIKYSKISEFVSHAKADSTELNAIVKYRL